MAGNRVGAGASPARRAAARICAECRKRDARARDVMRADEGLASLDPRDRALATRLVLGVTATTGLLDNAIDSAISGRTHLEPRVRDALRISAFELLYLDTPSRVAVSQGVELVKRAAPRAKGLANAVLRRIAEKDVPKVASARLEFRGESEDGRQAPSDVEAAALVSGMPEWLVARIAAGIGTPALRDVVLSQLEPAPVFVAANVARHGARSADVARAELDAIGADPVPAALPGSFALGNPSPLAGSGLVGDAEVVVCDLAAQAVAAIASPDPGTRMLEVGQGRATKTLLMQGHALMRGGFAHVTSIDSVAGKIDLARRRLARDLPGECVSLAFDACELASDELPGVLAHAFDSVFVDAPCSGTGTMRRHPETPWSLGEESVCSELPKLQLRILQAASSRVRRGGTLTYSTCSLLAEENERVIEAFLASDAGADFGSRPVTDAPGMNVLSADARDLIAAHTTSDGFLRTHPVPDGLDGHFCARLVRGH